MHECSVSLQKHHSLWPPHMQKRRSLFVFGPIAIHPTIRPEANIRNFVCNFEVNVQRFTCWVLTEFKLKSSMSSSASILSPGITMFSFNLSLSFLFSFEASFFFLAKEAKAKLIQASSFSL